MTNMERYVINGSKLIRRQQHGSVRMSYMYGICYVPFFFSKNRSSKVLFSNPFPKNAQIVNLKNPDLDLIRRIHPEGGFCGFMIRFWICQKKNKNAFLDSEIRIWIFPQKNAPLVPRAETIGFECEYYTIYVQKAVNGYFVT